MFEVYLIITASLLFVGIIWGTLWGATLYFEKTTGQKEDAYLMAKRSLQGVLLAPLWPLAAIGVPIFAVYAALQYRKDST